MEIFCGRFEKSFPRNVSGKSLREKSKKNSPKIPLQSFAVKKQSNASAHKH
jgi:hypothetical protein